ncbi:MAG TPA: hypothetical protein VN810_09800 [Terriglobales bacterium]|nr:hypothetical protein [Terriglobales bacterium]
MDIRYKPDRPGKIRFGRIFSLATLLISVAALVLALRKPQPVAPRQTPAAIAANAQSFQAKVSQLEQAREQGQSGSEVRLTAGEIGAAIAQAQGAVPVSPAQGRALNAAGPPAGTSAAAAPVEPANLQEPIISFEGDIVRGQFVTEVAGKKTYVTVAGHLGSKDGYATFEPTEFKVGDLSVPVSLVNDALQKKMLEQQDRLKLPDFVSDMRVENGQLVVTQK